MTIEEVREANGQFESADPGVILDWAVQRFGTGLRLACSFGLEDVALVHMLCQRQQTPSIFMLDTGRLHQETYNLLERHRQRYGIEFDVMFPQADQVEALLRAKGPNSFYASIENRKECCGIRKVEPLKRALCGATAWVTGLRRSQSVTRTSVDIVSIDPEHGDIAKINPLANWSESQVREFVERHQIPYHPLHDKGYPSIGCLPCTRAVQPGEDIRAGRWWWESPEHKECGLHARRS